MKIELIKNYCLSKKQAAEKFPFDDHLSVYKVLGKIFAIVRLTPPYSMNLKCDPERVVELLQGDNEVTPGYHTEKTHWNRIDLESNIHSKLIKECIVHSDELVINKLNEKQKEKFLTAEKSKQKIKN